MGNEKRTISRIVGKWARKTADLPKRVKNSVVSGLSHVKEDLKKGYAEGA